MFGLLVSALAFLLVSAVFARHLSAAHGCLRHSRSLSAGPRQPGLTIIKPIKGIDRFSEANLRSWCEQDYQGSVQIVFSFQDPNDPALDPAREIDAIRKPEIIVNPVKPGYSGKMSNLLHGLQIARHDLLVFSDADILAGRDTCARIAAQVGQGDTLVSCLIRHCRPRNLWARIYAAFWNFEHLAFLAPLIRKQGSAAIGGTMAMKQGTLQRLGGLEAFKDFVAEDVAMGARAAQLGIPVVLGPLLDSPVDAMSFAELTANLARAALFGVTSNAWPHVVHYTLLYCYLLVLGAAAISGSGLLLGLGLALALLRMALASAWWSLLCSQKRPAWECFVQDLVFLGVFVRALFSRTLIWGGQTYRVDAQGRMYRL